LVKLSEIAGFGLDRDPEILGLTADSRQVAPGWLFAAMPGCKTDGRAYIRAAVAAGAVAVIAPEGSEDVPGDVLGDAVLLTAAEPRRMFARFAASFYAVQPPTLAAVTGTNGKTSVSVFTRQLWARLGRNAASLGTVGVVSPKRTVSGGLTTPDPVTLHRLLAELAGDGVTHACLEASSHGLDQYRLDGLALSAGAFTNLTRDHLDYHLDMEAYARAKLRLFRDLLPAGAPAVLNADSEWYGRFHEICDIRNHRILSFGENGKELALLERVAGADAQRLTLDVLGKRHTVRLPLAGAFQASNALCALGLVIGCGADVDDAVAALETLEGVPGRLQAVAEYNEAPILVDYAHTPDALATVLQAVRPHVARRLFVVFGCGGDRDPGKRPQMGAVAEELADEVIITDDNPRTEDPDLIRSQILATCPKAVELGDRTTAIAAAIAELAPGDVLVVAGKGHEQGQIIGDEVHPFDDATVCRQVVEALEGER
jgi:UDP-N-acetylmuramoyl-L-alanyl-D-glutamate--2,6-diaminopimelate ligase